MSSQGKIIFSTYGPRTHWLIEEMSGDAFVDQVHQMFSYTYIKSKLTEKFGLPKLNQSNYRYEVRAAISNNQLIIL